MMQTKEKGRLQKKNVFSYNPPFKKIKRPFISRVLFMQSSIWHCRCRQHLAAYPRVLDGQPTRFLALLLTRFTMRSASLRSRWALTPPFHPYLQSRRFAFCCTVCSLTAPGRYPASCPMELGLSSRALENQRQSDCLKNLTIQISKSEIKEYRGC